jgi:hypothetical protein
LDSARASGSKRRDLLAALAGAAAWFSAGTVAFTSGGADRVAAFPPLIYLAVAVVLAVIAARLARLRLEHAWPLAMSLLIFLPFVPGPNPHVFMLWQGPIEAIVWGVVITGLIVAARSAEAAQPRRPTTRFSDPERAPWIAAIVVAALSLVAFSQVRAVVPGGDEPHYLVATQSLIADRDLKVENNYAAGSYLDYFAGRLQPHFLRRSTAGEIYSIHSPGVSVIVLPAFALAGYPGAVATVILISALTAALTWSVAFRVSQSAAAAWAGTMAVFATAPFLFHTFTIYPDAIGALPVMLAIWLLVRLADGDDCGQPTLAGVGAALAVLPWLHTRLAILAVMLGVAVLALLARQRIRPTRMAAFLAAPAVAAAAWLSYFWIIWGTPNPAAPYGPDTGSSLSYIARGLSGLIFDQQHGVLGTAPVYAVAVIGVWPLLRARRSVALTMVAVAVIYTLAVSTYAMWWGGTSAPARFVAALLPMASLLIAAAWASYPQMRMAVLLLLVVSIAIVIPRVTEEAGRLVFNSRNAFDPTIEWLSRHVDLSLALPVAHRDPPGVVFRDAMPWLAAIAIVVLQSFAAARTVMSAGLRWMLAAGSAAVVVMVTVTVVWMMRGTQPATADRSVLAALSSVRPWHTTMADVSRRRTLAREEFLSRLSIEAAAEPSVALLRLRRVPPGEYELTAGASVSALAATVNRTDPILESGTTPFRLRLPVAVATLSVRAEAATTSGLSALRLTPVGTAVSAAPDGRAALRAARYGRARVFVFDERAYLEPGGFWTRAEGRATVVIDADDEARQRGLPIAITGGAAATTIGISVGEWSRSYSMTPGQRREIALPPLGGEAAWVVSIHSGPGFRPFEREPGSGDVRALAAWFEIP